MNEQGQSQPGWYPDPSGPAGRQRWWDGNRWTDHTQSAQKSGTSNTLMIVLIVLGVLTVLTIGGCVACAALVGEGAEDLGREFERELNREFKQHAITKQEFDSVELGSRRSAVERRLGPPADRQEFENEIPGDEPVGSSCIYYNRAGGELGDRFQFCFSGGRLDSKNSY
jgi:Protein of unknown function (DUF2510)